MCEIVIFEGRTLHSVGELRAQGWPVALEDVSPILETDMDNSCFCCVDVDLILTRAGVTFTYDPDYGGEYRIQ